MGNLSQELNTGKIKLSLNSDKLKEGLIELISFDLDYTENEEYFREDTLSLGYENEAERVVEEYLEKNKIKNKSDLTRCCSEILSQVFDSSSYYGDWDFVINETKKEKEFVVFYTYIT